MFQNNVSNLKVNRTSGNNAQFHMCHYHHQNAWIFMRLSYSTVQQPYRHQHHLYLFSTLGFAPSPRSLCFVRQLCLHACYTAVFSSSLVVVRSRWAPQTAQKNVATVKNAMRVTYGMKSPKIIRACFTNVWTLSTVRRQGMHVGGTDDR